VAKSDEPSYDYSETAWEVAAKKDDWEKINGKRVSLKVVITRIDNDWQLPEAPKDSFSVFMVRGSEGMDSPGLPLRVYVKKGTKHERVLNNAKSYSSGPVDQTYFIRGVAKTNRQMIAEVIERAD
jgi:hypothetical protein